MIPTWAQTWRLYTTANSATAPVAAAAETPPAAACCVTSTSQRGQHATAKYSALHSRPVQATASVMSFC